MSEERIVQIPIGDLHDCRLYHDGQPRTHYDEEALRELADSIRQNGVLQALLVRPDAAGGYEVLGGHRRLRASKIAGIATVPCVVRALDDEQARLLVVLDNLSREDFLPWEEGRAYSELRAAGYTIDGIAQKTGRAQATISARIALAGVGTVLQRLYLDGELTLYALEQVAELPNETMSPRRCPKCQGVNREESTECAACGTSLCTVLALPVGNPQEAAAQMSRNKPNAQVQEILRRVRQSYGLDRQVVQTSLGLSIDEIEQCAVDTRHQFELMLERIGKMGEQLCNEKALKSLRSATKTQKAGVQQQLVAAQSILKTLAQELGQATLEVA